MRSNTATIQSPTSSAPTLRHHSTRRTVLVVAG
jgi:hypothetical protein